MMRVRVVHEQWDEAAGRWEPIQDEVLRAGTCDSVWCKICYPHLYWENRVHHASLKCPACGNYPDTPQHEYACPSIRRGFKCSACIDPEAGQAFHNHPKDAS